MSENNYGTNNNQNPSGIWQTVWGTLFSQFNEQMLNNEYLRAWKTIQLLKSQIPPECEKDIEQDYQKLKALIKKPTNTYTVLQAMRDKKRQLEEEAPTALLELISNIRKSLYDRKWITKETGFPGIDPNKASTDI
jgi:hypothetical protein